MRYILIISCVFFAYCVVRVPVCGAIILNPTLDKVLLVKGILFRFIMFIIFQGGPVNHHGDFQKAKLTKTKKNQTVPREKFLKKRVLRLESI